MKTIIHRLTITFLIACLLGLAACSSEPKTAEEIIERSIKESSKIPMHMNLLFQVPTASVGMDIAVDANSSEEANVSGKLALVDEYQYMEEVIVGGEVFVKPFGASEWSRSTFSPSEALKQFEAFDPDLLQEVTLVGEEEFAIVNEGKIVSVPVYHIQAKMPIPRSLESLTSRLAMVGTMDINYYVAKETYLPLKLTGQYKLLLDTAELEVNYADWGKESIITAPIP